MKAEIQAYIRDCRARARQVSAERLTLKDCVGLQKRHLLKDLVRNPINALWAIPYVSLKKGLEVGDKMGWEFARSLGAKLPAAFRTDFQKEVERVIAKEVFFPGKFSVEDVELAKQMERDIRQEIHEFSVKTGGLSDIFASLFVLLVAENYFGDRSLDIFGIGKGIAKIWAKDDAVSNFVFGENLGRAFYSLAPAPQPTTFQIVLATALALAGISVMSTAVSIVSIPIQRRLGFHDKQIDRLVERVEDRLLLRLAKSRD